METNPANTPPDGTDDPNPQSFPAIPEYDDEQDGPLPEHPMWHGWHTNPDPQPTTDPPPNPKSEIPNPKSSPLPPYEPTDERPNGYPYPELWGPDRFEAWACNRLGLYTGQRFVMCSRERCIHFYAGRKFGKFDEEPHFDSRSLDGAHIERYAENEPPPIRDDARNRSEGDAPDDSPPDTNARAVAEAIAAVRTDLRAIAAEATSHCRRLLADLVATPSAPTNPAVIAAQLGSVRSLTLALQRLDALITPPRPRGRPRKWS